MSYSFKELLQKGVHLGHPKSKRNPYMKYYIYQSKESSSKDAKGLYEYIDLHKTIHGLNQSCEFIKNIIASGKDILFVGTKPQAKHIIAECAKSVNMPYVNERWLGGMLTNFTTVRKTINKKNSLESRFKNKNKQQNNPLKIKKKELLQNQRSITKIVKNLGSIEIMRRLPGVLFVVDTNKEHIALAEASKLGIPIVAMNDTNTNPNKVTYPIASNDDLSGSISIICQAITDVVNEGLSQRKLNKTAKHQQKEEENTLEDKTSIDTEKKISPKKDLKKVEKIEAKQESQEPQELNEGEKNIVEDKKEKEEQ